MAKKKTSKADVKKETFFSRVGVDLIRIILGIIILSVLLSVSLSMINGKFAEKQEELTEDNKKQIGWVVMNIGYVVPLALVGVIPVVACIGSKKDDQRKHLVKALILVGAAVAILVMFGPKQLSDLTKQREFCQMLEQRADEEEEFIYPEYEPTVKEVTTKLQRTVKWYANALLGFAVVGAYQGVRYKKLRDGEPDDEIPEDELTDDLPDVDWYDRNEIVYIHVENFID